MLKRKTALAALAMASAVWGGSTQIAQAQSTCNLATAKQSLDPAVLCECKVVTTQMLRYIQRQDEFLNVLAGVTQECPAFADALNALPTATSFVDRVLHREKDGGGLNIPSSGPDDKPKPKPGPKPGDNPDPEGPGGDNPGDNPNPEGPGGDNPSPEGPGGDNPRPKGCGGEGGGGGDGRVNARAEGPRGCND